MPELVSRFAVTISIQGSEMTRSELAAAIRKLAAGELTDEEWRAAMVNHYADIETESARSRAVRLHLNYEGLNESEVRSALNEIADSLEAPGQPGVFYFMENPVGTLGASIPEEGRVEISYEPTRSIFHGLMQGSCRDGQWTECEYWKDDVLQHFVVLSCPAYGRLLVENSGNRSERQPSVSPAIDSP
ncbi:hypothetical protein [Luteolibacter sp. Populi]|uniref:hypothetical protein n=1 Tax=Luteolibacter sp. Populi TaxID=3230487 RepID=UPI003465BCEC